MEAWLKFQAPGISISLGLGIGRLVFGALNKVEWVFAASVIIEFSLSRKGLVKSRLLLVAIPLSILLVQTFYMLPFLDARAERYIQNLTNPPSNIHFYYVATEVIKVLGLFSLGASLLKYPEK